MRATGALVLVMVFLAAMVETHPPRAKRGIKLCSARDVKFMATYVCNLHRRSVRSVDQHSDDNYETTGVEALGGGNSRAWRSSRCGPSGSDCAPQFDSLPFQPSAVDFGTPAVISMADVERWLSQNGYHRLILPEYSSFPWQTKNGPTNNGAASNRNIENELYQSNYGTGVMGDLRATMNKRDKEIDFPVMVPRSLSDIRKNCCVRECTAEDFYGACS
ncbi:uncharacterized protein LOC121853206 [Homarus americanus]|uniref:uncharacterized protein LOC121853206 n=1 Tax=Homarus americanus TaxID=6706 RepID=UPI001C450DB3|nr:uncharacterized protein LOC121853206 [Homarus americanus]